MMLLTREQVRAVDRIAIERYGVPGIVLMENAARGAAEAAGAMLGEARGAGVLVLCGGGNNGGDGLAVARHLHNRGAQVHIALTIDPARYAGDALLNWRIVEAMALPHSRDPIAALGSRRWDLVIDAIFGTGLTQAPRPPFDAIAEAVNRAGTPVLAVDIPSGLDCDTGRPWGPCLRATKTVTFVAQKVGFATPDARQYTGEVIVADIGCPREAIEAAMRASGR